MQNVLMMQQHRSVRPPCHRNRGSDKTANFFSAMFSMLGA
jgi:hypothetical protein